MHLDGLLRYTRRHEIAVVELRDMITATFVQYSDLLLTPDSTMREFYRRACSALPGYYFPTHFMEIPYWIPLIAGKMPDAAYRKRLFVVDNHGVALARFKAATAEDVFLLSVLEANADFVLDLASKTQARMVLGGYTDEADFAGMPHVTYLRDVEDVGSVLPAIHPGPLDYRLFSGERCIPRFSLSTGCSFRCAFCTVPTKLRLTPVEAIAPEIDALRPLDFRLVFLDDKSFGEAPNWREIRRVRDQILTFNPDFLGFIVQMPPSLGSRPGFLSECYELGVRYVEFGVEIVHDAALAWMRKPFRVKHLETTMAEARRLGLKVIPNFILGIPGRDYGPTVAWVKRNRDIIPVVNINWLSIHYGNERGDLGLPASNVADRDQNSTIKTWLSDADRRASLRAMEQIYELTAPRREAGAMEVRIAT